MKLKPFQIPKGRTLLIGAALILGLITLIVILSREIKTNIYVHDSGVILKRALTGSPRDSSVLVSTNRNLVKYDPTTGTTRPLMKDGVLPQILDLAWSEDESYAVFQSSGQNKQDTLGEILDSQLQSSEANVWWIADFKTKEYKPVGSGVTSVGWIDKDNIYAVGTPLGSSAVGLHTSSVTELEFILVHQQDDLLNAYPISDGFLLYSSVNLKGSLSKIAREGGTPKLFLKDLSRAPEINRAGTLLAAMTNDLPYDDDPGYTEDTLALINTLDGRTIKKLAEKQPSGGYWSPSGDSFYFERIEGEKNRIVQALISTNKNKVSAKISNLDISNLPQSSLSKIIPLVNGGLLLVDQQNKIYIANSQKIAPFKSFQTDTVGGSTGLQGDGFGIYYYSATNFYGISIAGEPRETYKQKALETLKKAGVNTDLADIVYEGEYEPIGALIPEDEAHDEANHDH